MEKVSELEGRLPRNDCGRSVEGRGAIGLGLFLAETQDGVVGTGESAFSADWSKASGSKVPPGTELADLQSEDIPRQESVGHKEDLKVRVPPPRRNQVWMIWRGLDYSALHRRVPDEVRWCTSSQLRADISVALFLQFLHPPSAYLCIFGFVFLTDSINRVASVLF